MSPRKTLKKEVREAKKEIKDVFKWLYRNCIRAAYIKLKRACGHALCLPFETSKRLNKVGKKLIKSR